jgi:hypothetical protein
VLDVEEHRTTRPVAVDARTVEGRDVVRLVHVLGLGRHPVRDGRGHLDLLRWPAALRLVVRRRCCRELRLNVPRALRARLVLLPAAVDVDERRAMRRNDAVSAAWVQPVAELPPPLKVALGEPVFPAAVDLLVRPNLVEPLPDGARQVLRELDSPFAEWQLLTAVEVQRVAATEG